MIEAEVQMSLFGESEEEMAAAWLMERYADAKQDLDRDLSFKDWLDWKFNGWECGTFFGGEFDTFMISSKGLELRGKDEKVLFFKREQIYRMFGITEAGK